MCVTPGEPILVVAAGDTRVDTKLLGAAKGVSKRRFRMASASDCVKVFGYSPGGVSPIGLRTVCEVFVDAYV